MDLLKALFVDDETEYLETAIKRMKKRGMDIIGVSGGAEALTILSKHKIDVVIMDMRMPGMDGIQALREIKLHHPLVEVIMLTGHASMEAAIQGMELGAFDYLMKPIDIDELIYKVQDAFQKRLLQIKKIESMEKMRR